MSPRPEYMRGPLLSWYEVVRNREWLHVAVPESGIPMAHGRRRALLGRTSPISNPSRTRTPSTLRLLLTHARWHHSGRTVCPTNSKVPSGGWCDVKGPLRLCRHEDSKQFKKIRGELVSKSLYRRVTLVRVGQPPFPLPLHSHSSWASL